MSDVWSPGKDEAALAGEPRYGEGFFVNQVFSIDVVLRNGLAFVREQPVYALVGGLVLFLLQFVPSFVGGFLQIGAQLWIDGLQPNPQPGSTGALVGQLVQLVVVLLAFPFVQLVQNGLILGAAQYAATEQASWSALFTSVMAAVRGFLYALVVGLGMSVVFTLVDVVPASLVAAILYAAGAPTAAVVAGAVVVFLLGLIPVCWVGLGLGLGTFAAVIDGQWPIGAMQASWSAANGGRLTLLVTSLVVGFATFLSMISVYCLVGLVLTPIVNAVVFGGMAISWLMYARSEADLRRMAFFERTGLPG